MLRWDHYYCYVMRHKHSHTPKKRYTLDEFIRFSRTQMPPFIIKPFSSTHADAQTRERDSILFWRPHFIHETNENWGVSCAMCPCFYHTMFISSYKKGDICVSNKSLCLLSNVVSFLTGATHFLWRTQITKLLTFTLQIFTWNDKVKLINVTFFLLISKENTLKLMMMLLFRFSYRMRDRMLCARVRKR